MNSARVSNPDLDIDIQDDRRHEVVTYTIQKYGADRVARIITFGTMGAKAALNDVGRAMPELFGDNYQAILKPITGSISARWNGTGSSSTFATTAVVTSHN